MYENQESVVTILMEIVGEATSVDPTVLDYFGVTQNKGKFQC